jgi:hypothetical protein
MTTELLDSTLSRSRALDLSGLDWDLLRSRPLPAAAVRTLRYMQDIESHTVLYLRTLLSTRAVDDAETASFLACWFYEETFHGLALARLLAANGTPAVPRVRSRTSLREKLHAAGAAFVSRAWPDFVAVHMLWGAINELTTLCGYRRLAAVTRHPLLSELLARIIRDESRHFGFYFEQARRRLGVAATGRRARALVERFWAPVGSRVQPAAEVRFVAHHLFDGPDGRAEARKVDDTIRRLPGMHAVALLEAWLDRPVALAPS